MKKFKRIKWIAFFLCILSFFLISYNLEALQPMDEAVSLFIASMRSPVVTLNMKFISDLASPFALIIGSMILAFVVRQRKFWVPIFLNLTFAVILNLGLKEIYARPRPAVISQLVSERGFSFPSGHSMGAAAFYGFVIYIIFESKLSALIKRLLTALTLITISLIGLSRIYLGVHYLSDIVAGYLISSLYLIMFTGFVHAYFAFDESLSNKLKGVGSKHSLIHSFAHAFDGIIHGLKAERNMVIHFAAMAIVITFALVLRCSTTEWCIFLILFALVIGCELLNTAIETAIDLSSPDIHPLAKIAKDTAAGAVLIASLAAATIGFIIFGPKLWVLLLIALP
ncbi:MAG: phosphatase PAP2 family protein [Clostridiales bacterium]|nr:phosphatase PAP2 family protein [Clostridiales bacterium]